MIATIAIATMFSGEWRFFRLILWSFITQNEGTKTTKPKAIQQKANPQKQKTTALKRIAYLSGYNLKNVKIMSDSDFINLTTYICALIDTDTVPQNIQPIQSTGVSNEYLRYTFYLIHKELYTTRPIRPEWIELLTHRAMAS